MAAAATQVAAERIADLGVGGMRVRREQGGGGHDHAADAVAALPRLLVDEGPLQRMRGLRGAEAFNGHDRLLRRRRDRHDAGSDRDAADMDGAGAALAEAAAELRA